MSEGVVCNAAAQNLNGKNDYDSHPRDAQLDIAANRGTSLTITYTLDCCKMDEVTRPKLYHLSSCSIQLPDSKSFFFCSSNDKNQNPYFSGSWEVGKLASIVLSCVHMLEERRKTKAMIYFHALFKEFWNFQKFTHLAKQNLDMEAF